MTTKQNSKQKNALIHGTYARDIILPWEDEQEFNELHEQIKIDLPPKTILQAEVVFEITLHMWKKRRLLVGSKLAYLSSPQAKSLKEAGKEGEAGIAQYLADELGKIDRFRHHVLDDLKDLSAMARTTVGDMQALLREELDAESRGDSAKDNTSRRQTLTKMQEFIQKQMEGQNSALKLMADRELDETIAESAYRPEIIEREMRLLAMLNGAIDKLLARYYRLEEARRLYAAKDVQELKEIGLDR